MMAADGFDGPRRKVLVTGAAGRTGSLVFKKLQAKPEFMPVGLVRSSKSAGKLRKATGATEEQVLIGDAMDPASLAKAMAGCDSVILCSSATPKVRDDSCWRECLLCSSQPAPRMHAPTPQPQN